MRVTIIGGDRFTTDKDVVVVFRDCPTPALYKADKIEHLYLSGREIQTIEILNDKE